MNLNTEQSLRQIMDITTQMEKEIHDECGLHMRNEVSANILQRRLHEGDVIIRDCFTDSSIKEIIKLKSHFIEKYATHIDFEKGIAMHDAEIERLQSSKNQSFEQYVALNPDYRKWRCCDSMRRF